MSSVNRVFLRGRLGKDPEVRTFSHDGYEVVSFSLATSDSWKDKKTGEFKKQVEWHKVVVMNSSLQSMAKSLRKGSEVYVEGKLQHRKWTDPKGFERTVTEIVLPKFGGSLSFVPEDKGSKETGYHSEEARDAAERLKQIAILKKAEEEIGKGEEYDIPF